MNAIHSSQTNSLRYKLGHYQMMVGTWGFDPRTSSISFRLGAWFARDGPRSFPAASHGRRFRFNIFYSCRYLALPGCWFGTRLAWLRFDRVIWRLYASRFFHRFFADRGRLLLCLNNTFLRLSQNLLTNSA